MVKVAENKVIDLDVFPGDKRGEELAQQARDAVQGKIPPEEAQGFLANAQGAMGAVAGTVGGSLKGVVDTTGNTVGTLAQGLQGTVQGVGDGLGSTVQFAGGAVGAGVGQVGNYFTGQKPADAELESKAKSSTEPVADSSDKDSLIEQTERKILPDEYKATAGSTGKASVSES